MQGGDRKAHLPAPAGEATDDLRSRKTRQRRNIKQCLRWSHPESRRAIGRGAAIDLVASNLKRRTGCSAVFKVKSRATGWQPRPRTKFRLNATHLITIQRIWNRIGGVSREKQAGTYRSMRRQLPNLSWAGNVGKFHGYESRTGSPDCQSQYHWPIAQWGPSGLAKRRLVSWKMTKCPADKAGEWNITTKSWSHQQCQSPMRHEQQGTESIRRCKDTTMDMPIIF